MDGFTIQHNKRFTTNPVLLLWLTYGTFARACFHLVHLTLAQFTSVYLTVMLGSAERALAAPADLRQSEASLEPRAVATFTAAFASYNNDLNECCY